MLMGLIKIKSPHDENILFSRSPFGKTMSFYLVGDIEDINEPKEFHRI